MSSAAAALAAALDKAIGVNEEEQAASHFIDTGYEPLNEIISGRRDGGVPQGRITEIYGPSSAGKTALATKLMISAQQQGGIAIFLDHERSFDAGMGQALGLSVEPGLWVYKFPETWEESNTLMLKAAEVIRENKLIAPDAPIIAVTDSVAACIPKSVMFDAKTGKRRGIDELTMNDTTALARVTSTTLKVVKARAREFNLTAVYLNQIRTKPGVSYGDPTTTPGGVAMEFYADVRLSLGKKRIMEEQDGEKVMKGLEIGIKTAKNKITRPFQECDYRLMFAPDGRPYFDVVGSLVQLLIDAKKMPSAGYIPWDGKKLYKKALIDYVYANKQERQLYDLFYASGVAPVSAAKPAVAAAVLETALAE
jgi:protein RecA